jgi:hypothetical protein
MIAIEREDARMEQGSRPGSTFPPDAFVEPALARSEAGTAPPGIAFVSSVGAPTSGRPDHGGRVGGTRPDWTLSELHRLVDDADDELAALLENQPRQASADLLPWARSVILAKVRWDTLRELVGEPVRR